MKTALLTALALFAVASGGAQGSAIAKAPPAIQELAQALTFPDMTPERVRAAIISRLGPPQRNVGSGLRIEQWDIAGGALTFHPYRGPTFSDPKTKKTLYLLPTANPVQVNLLQTYDMTTLPDPTNHRTRFWIGTLKIGTDQTYQFVESFQHIHEPRLHTETFFLRHPMGKVAIRYANSISSGTLLETMPEGATLAHLTFTAREGTEEATFSIISFEQQRSLEFASEQPLNFTMSGGWRNFWP